MDTRMLQVAIGSKNPAKIAAVQSALTELGIIAEVKSTNAKSGVSEQPFSDDETIQGAVNRAREIMKESDVDYAIGLEGGVVDTPYGLFLCNWGAVINRSGIVGIGGGHRVELPPYVAERLRSGAELGDVIDEWMNRSNIKKMEGTIGVLTDNHITRQAMFRDVVIAAFVRFLHPEYYVKNRLE